MSYKVKVGGFHVHEEGKEWCEVGVVATYHDLGLKHVQGILSVLQDEEVAQAHQHFASVVGKKLYALGETYALMKGSMSQSDLDELKKVMP